MRDYKLYLDDIQHDIRKIQKYTKGRDLKDFRRDELVVDAVIRNLEIIGEASNRIPSEVTRQISADIDWKKISALRNILIHEYFGVDVEILWDIVIYKIPELKKAVGSFLKAEK